MFQTETLSWLWVRRCPRVCLHVQDEGGQGELVATLMGLAEALVGAEARSGVLSSAMADIVLAEKALAVVQTCLTGTT